MGHGGLAGPPARAPEKMRHDAFSSVDLLAYLVIFSRRGERMSDSDTGTIMAKVYEYKRKAHDLRDEAHTVTARAAIKGGPPAGGQVQDSGRRGARPRVETPQRGNRARAKHTGKTGQRRRPSQAHCHHLRYYN